MKPKIAIIKDFLIKEYIQNKKSIKDIANQIKKSYTFVYNRMVKYNIKRRTLSEANFNRKYSKKFKFTKPQLIKLYIIKHLSIYKISKIFNCSATSVNNNLKNFHIKRHRLDYPSPFKNRHHTKKSKKLLCFSHKGLTYNINIETQKRLSEFRRKKFQGKDNPNWQGGINKLGYYCFTKKLRESIRYRDGYKCLLCGCPEVECYRKLDIHHIDYNKENINKTNLITLCQKCNIKANYNRDYYYAYFTYIMENYIYV